MTPIIDITSGSRMMWFDKNNPLATFVDKRVLHTELSDGRPLDIEPDVKADWTVGLPFDDNSFHLAVFDPPHLIHAGENSWLAQKYGTLESNNWQPIIRDGFDEAIADLKVK